MLTFMKWNNCVFGVILYKNIVGTCCHINMYGDSFEI